MLGDWTYQLLAEAVLLEKSCQEERAGGSMAKSTRRGGWGRRLCLFSMMFVLLV